MINADQIKNSVNIVDVIGSYIDIKRKGANYFACCPFHGEKTPSFSINEKNQFYKCFGCGVSGDVINFVMEYTGCEFLDAVKQLGGVIEHRPPSKAIKTAINIRLPLDKKPYDKSDIDDFKKKCELINNVYFYGKNQVINITDINKNNISIGLYDGLNMRFFREFLYGSCFVFGDIKQSDTIIMTNCYSLGLKTFNKLKTPLIVFFKALNLRFINNEIKRHNKKIIVISCDQDVLEYADDLNLQFQKVDHNVSTSA